MKPGCTGADSVNREERVNDSESKGNHEVDNKESSVSASFYFIAHGKFHLSDKRKILLYLAWPFASNRSSPVAEKSFCLSADRFIEKVFGTSAIVGIRDEAVEIDRCRHPFFRHGGQFFAICFVGPGNPLRWASPPQIRIIGGAGQFTNRFLFRVRWFPLDGVCQFQGLFYLIPGSPES